MRAMTRLIVQWDGQVFLYSPHNYPDEKNVHLTLPERMCQLDASRVGIIKILDPSPQWNK